MGLESGIDQDLAGVRSMDDIQTFSTGLPARAMDCEAAVCLCRVSVLRIAELSLDEMA